MKNLDIRKYAKENGVKLFANELYINDGNFSRKLRHELSEDDKWKIRQLIDKIADDNRWETD